jgi:hypothetical protein
MPGDLKNFTSQVQNRIDSEETGEEVLRDARRKNKDLCGFQLNEAGGPLGEEFAEQD